MQFNLFKFYVRSHNGGPRFGKSGERIEIHEFLLSPYIFCFFCVTEYRWRSVCFFLSLKKWKLDPFHSIFDLGRNMDKWDTYMCDDIYWHISIIQTIYEMEKEANEYIGKNRYK